MGSRLRAEAPNVRPEFDVQHGTKERTAACGAFEGPGALRNGTRRNRLHTRHQPFYQLLQVAVQAGAQHLDDAHEEVAGARGQGAVRVPQAAGAQERAHDAWHDFRVLRGDAHKAQLQANGLLERHMA